MHTATLEFNKPDWREKSDFYKLSYLRSLAKALEEKEEANYKEIRALLIQYQGAVYVLNKPLHPQKRRLQWFYRCTFHLN
jgi:uncharacterized protein (UPF0305 family)